MKVLLDKISLDKDDVMILLREMFNFHSMHAHYADFAGKMFWRDQKKTN